MNGRSQNPPQPAGEPRPGPGPRPAGPTGPTPTGPPRTWGADHAARVAEVRRLTEETALVLATGRRAHLRALAGLPVAEELAVLDGVAARCGGGDPVARRLDDLLDELLPLIGPAGASPPAGH